MGGPPSIWMVTMGGERGLGAEFGGVGGGEEEGRG
jgi:hypothetical protein